LNFHNPVIQSLAIIFLFLKSTVSFNLSRNNLDNDLKSRYNKLDISYQRLWSKYDLLMSGYGELKRDYDALRLSYESAISELRRVEGELFTTKISIYILSLCLLLYL